ncbi:MAG: DNA-binding protein WhiA [Actinobacteria bacterium]|nr:DNA-binding protein WhiA [Actinomycetota bacterium]
MSFTVEVLEEIVNSSEEDSSSLLAEFIGVTIVSGYIRLTHSGPELIIKTQRPVSARRIVRLSRTLFDARIGPLIYSENAFEKWYEISISGKILFDRLSKLGILSGLGGVNIDALKALYKKNKNFSNSFLRGVFLVGGYVQNPKQGRDLEIVVSDERVQKVLADILSSEGFKVGTRYRKHKYYIYFKSYEDIKDFLRRIGAVSASFKFEDQQTINEMKNYVNRQVNFEKANVERIVNSAIKQMEAIIIIDREIGINNLTPALREAADLRLKHPDLSLSELAKKAKGKITKSGLRHRLLRLEKIANELKKKRKGVGEAWQ